MFEEQRSKRSVITIDPEEYNVSYNESAQGRNHGNFQVRQPIWWA